jgi:hypothetical protein
MEAMLRSIPPRVARPRAVALDDVAETDAMRGVDSAETLLMEKDTQRMSIETNRIVRDALATMPGRGPHDRPLPLRIGDERG